MFISQKGKSIKLYLAAILFLSFGLYLIFDQFLFITGKEIVKSWYHGELVSLQEGQILPAIAKNQSVFNKSPFIRSVVVVDSKEPGRNLFSVGVQRFKVTDELLKSSEENDDTVLGHREGFLSMNVIAKIPGKNDLHIIYEISSRFLIWSYFGCVSIGILFISYLIGITVRIGNIERKKRDELRSDLIRRLAHDINSPILALSGISMQVRKLDEKLHFRIERITESIRSLFAQTDKVDREILKVDANPSNEMAEYIINRDFELIPIVPVLLEIFNQMRSEFSLEAIVDFKIDISSVETDIFVQINVEEFKRHFSNLIKNSIEARAKSICVGLKHSSSSILIQINDDGNGIPEEVLSKIGTKGFSFGKSDGKGLGLFYALATIKHWQGVIDVSSEISVGTKIGIKLPTQPKPNWYISEIFPLVGKKLVLIDDDLTMVDRWVGHLKLKPGEYLSFNSATKFKDWFNNGGQFEENLQFVFDYHLEKDVTGLDIIEELGIESESILVTSAYLDSNVLVKAEILNVPILPKILVNSNALSG
jgi:signal transduction histidine kinase